LVSSKSSTISVLKLRCYQCNQPYQCGHGVCYGDLCVKTSISQNNAYVSKGFFLDVQFNLTLA
uniref:Zf-C5HC2 domain-containing protein n=1 Tax=Haemonchus placei TaxID=6290 RepID=A0A0N4WT77_HAEPC